MTNKEKLAIWREISLPLRKLAWGIFFTLRDSIERAKEEAKELGLDCE